MIWMQFWLHVFLLYQKMWGYIMFIMDLGKQSYIPGRETFTSFVNPSTLNIYTLFKSLHIRYESMSHNQDFLYLIIKAFYIEWRHM